MEGKRENYEELACKQKDLKRTERVYMLQKNSDIEEAFERHGCENQNQLSR